MIRILSRFIDEESFPVCNIVVAGSLFPSVRGEVGLEFRKSPDSLLVLMKIGEGLQKLFTQKVDCLHEVGNDEVDPG